jgi:hypothetical protein
MKFNNKLILAFVLVALVTGLYRVFPNRPAGFAPQLAIALFSGFIFSGSKKWAYALPLLSMFLSDVVYQVLFITGKTEYGGFYGWGQFVNYALVATMALFGFLIKENKYALPIGVLSVIGSCTAYYLLSNTSVWLGNGGFHRPFTVEGYFQCLTDGLPFYKTSLPATFVFGIVLFGSYFLVKKLSTQKNIA